MRTLNTPEAQRVAELAVALSDGDRLSRGRRYQKRGQVSGVFVTKGEAVATVDGSRADPYEVTIATRLGNENIRQAAAAGDLVATVPNPGEIALTCVCPDWGDPCKHGVAALLELAAEIDDDVSLLLRWRGIDDVVVPAPTGTESLDQRAAAVVDGDDGLDPDGSGVVASFDPDDELAQRRLGRKKARRARDEGDPFPASPTIGGRSDDDDAAGGASVSPISGRRASATNRFDDEAERLAAVQRLRSTMSSDLAEPDDLVASGTLDRDAEDDDEVDDAEPERTGPLADFFNGAMSADGAPPVERLEEVALDSYRTVRIMLETHDAAPVIADAIESIADHWLGR